MISCLALGTHGIVLLGRKEIEIAARRFLAMMDLATKIIIFFLKNR
jgi:hypothetical protein